MVKIWKQKWFKEVTEYMLLIWDKLILPAIAFIVAIIIVFGSALLLLYGMTLQH